MSIITTFFTRISTLLQFLIPILQVLWKILNPHIKQLLDDLWEYTEHYVEIELPKLPSTINNKEKSKLKETVFNTSAKHALIKLNSPLTLAELNIAREIIHTKKTRV